VLRIARAQSLPPNPDRDALRFRARGGTAGIAYVKAGAHAVNSGLCPRNPIDNGGAQYGEPHQIHHPHSPHGITD